ncbi:YegP family protein [Gordonia sp. DT218]|uniref:YegP family protein n=1 Tax=Gordonia sp. DT218 TaxID=3416659 RepID=UPI003CF078C9
MAGTFHVKKNTGGHYYFNLVAANGEVVATSQAYSSKSAAVQGTTAVQHAAADATVVEDDD